MSGVLCSYCWFRKTSSGEETHLEYRDDLAEGDCVITKTACGHGWDDYSKAVSCPILKAFYSESARRRKKEKPESEHGFEQLTLF